jgi:hypothetical protein
MRRRNLCCVRGLIAVLLGASWLMPASAVAQAPQVPVTDTLSQEDLEELLGPIALYPDTLLANVMAACCCDLESKPWSLDIELSADVG